MKPPYKWDNYSDQPALLKDKIYKKMMRKRELPSLIKTIITALFVLPIALVLMPFAKRKDIESQTFFSLGVDYQREPDLTCKLLEELNVKHILVRIKLWELETLGELKEFIVKNRDRKITLKIIQDREHIADLKLLQNDLRTIFLALGQNVDIFEIGSTINRAKWGFFSVDEYSHFYQTAYDLRDVEFKDLKLIGSSVIDFEYHFTAHTLFNFFKYNYDGISSLLYVDRRGAPENMQLGFALSDKIALLNTMVRLSPKCKNEIHITEVNWPITGTAPYAPTSEHECVDEENYANFMLRYFLLAFASQQINSVSWHQLIATGYGLVDEKNGMKKREAFYTYKFMLQTLKDAQFLRLDIKRGYYILQFLIDEQLIQVHWSLKPTTIDNEEEFEIYSRDGKPITSKTIEISQAPHYIYITKQIPKKVNCL